VRFLTADVHSGAVVSPFWSLVEIHLESRQFLLLPVRIRAQIVGLSIRSGRGSSVAREQIPVRSAPPLPDLSAAPARSVRLLRPAASSAWLQLRPGSCWSPPPLPDLSG
jgi:hypothetical protein